MVEKSPVAQAADDFEVCIFSDRSIRGLQSAKRSQAGYNYDLLDLDGSGHRMRVNGKTLMGSVQKGIETELGIPLSMQRLWRVVPRKNKSHRIHDYFERHEYLMTIEAQLTLPFFDCEAWFTHPQPIAHRNLCAVVLMWSVRRQIFLTDPRQDLAYFSCTSVGLCFLLFF